MTFSWVSKIVIHADPLDLFKVIIFEAEFILSCSATPERLFQKALSSSPVVLHYGSLSQSVLH